MDSLCSVLCCIILILLVIGLPIVIFLMLLLAIDKFIELRATLSVDDDLHIDHLDLPLDHFPTYKDYKSVFGK